MEGVQVAKEICEEGVIPMGNIRPDSFIVVNDIGDKS